MAPGRFVVLALFDQLTYQRYDPQRAIRTRRHKLIRHYGDRLEPVLPNVDDSPSKSLLIDAGWGSHPRPRVELYDLIMDPAEMRNLADVPDFAPLREELESRLRRGCCWPTSRLDGGAETSGSVVNDPSGVSATSRSSTLD